ncbi:zf-HC2 domain-containing protein [Nocardia sp. NBC_01329]|uniref:zf-HC2 domain-containing protein n=1 Tax=Nocardia sp. NBC_01329 TaxID=2903594 RepID=UPI002E0FB58B|nr:zf-HC2 domain-containing protein [Nocardia sp. NBC_01329]
MARESLSARLDGEAGPVPAARLDEHLTQCPDCRRWEAAATGLARQNRLTPVPPLPDLTDRILAAAPASRRRWPDIRFRVHRVLLACAGAAQLAVAAAQLGGVDFGMTVAHGGHAVGPAAHLLNESTAWTLASGTGFLVAAWRPRAASALLPVVSVFVVVLGGFVVTDWFQDRVTAQRLVSHSPVALGSVVLLTLTVAVRRDAVRGHRPADLDTEVAVSGPRRPGTGSPARDSAA